MNRRDEMTQRESGTGLMSRLKRFLTDSGPEADVDEYYEDDYADTRNAIIDYPDPEPAARPKHRSHKPIIEGGSNIVNFRNHFTGKQTEMVLAQPKDLEGAASVCTDICDNKACVVSLQGIDHAMAQRIADFIGGAVFSVGGDIMRVSNEIFIAAPASVHISSDVKNEIKKSSGRFFQWAANPV
jgi:cell division inhibitor SepF